MATHGRSGLNKVFMGSVAEKVIRIAPCPVLSIRSQIKSSLIKIKKSKDNIAQELFEKIFQKMELS